VEPHARVLARHVDGAVYKGLAIFHAGSHAFLLATDFVGGRIARFKRPHIVAFTDTLPRTADGAIDRDAVKAKFGATA